MQKDFFVLFSPLHGDWRAEIEKSLRGKERKRRYLKGKERVGYKREIDKREGMKRELYR